MLRLLLLGVMLVTACRETSGNQCCLGDTSACQRGVVNRDGNCVACGAFTEPCCANSMCDNASLYCDDTDSEGLPVFGPGTCRKLPVFDAGAD